jgi:U3 small nucleolar RNA-associated protein 20
MTKVEKLSVVSEVTHVRLQCRQVTLQYLVDYPLGRKLQSHLEFFVSQLEYEYETGRESVLEMMATIFSTFPQALLVEYSGLFFVPLASRLASDESPRCRRLTSLAIKSLLDKVTFIRRDDVIFNCQCC